MSVLSSALHQTQHTHICLCKIAEFWCGASSSTNKYQHTISCAALWYSLTCGSKSRQCRHIKQRRGASGCLPRPHCQNWGTLVTIFPQAEPGSDPLQCVTNLDVNIPPEKVADMTGFLVDVLNPSIMELRRLFLLESIFDTIKFILCLWGLTYIGSWYEITYLSF